VGVEVRLHSDLNSALEGNGLLASRPSRFMLEERASLPTALARNRRRFLGHPALILVTIQTTRSGLHNFQSSPNITEVINHRSGDRCSMFYA
jgi:hypothetical protein